MRTLATAFAVTLGLGLLQSAASAGPITAGLSMGLAESKADASANTDANKTIGLYGRLRFTPRLAGQLELSRINTDDQNLNIRSGTALLVVDLGSKGALVPILLAGIGVDVATGTYTSKAAHHIEGGLGLEYRAPGGFTIGVDARMGGRSIDSAAAKGPVLQALYRTSPSLSEGEYRSARITLGVRF